MQNIILIISTTMKQLILLCFVLVYSLSAYGQDRDLIVTTTGDSLKCKIIEIDSDEIQFRFGTGSIITIKRSEAGSYEYNYYALSSAKGTSKAKQEKNKPVRTPSHRGKLPFYAGITAGSSAYGSVTLGDTKGFAMALGGDAAYFFNDWLGAGIKLNTMICDVDFDRIKYHEMVMFLGPALYGHFGSNKMVFTVGAGGGMLNWSITKQENSDVSLKLNEETSMSAGGFISAGINYMLTRNMGIGLNIQTTFGSVTNVDDEKRNPTGIGGTLGINFRF